ncbi:hypothetical protein [Brevundimonas sp. TWP2-3-4b2]|uniref:hypothetical protein n=1 Tax=Brevundimonas sp. TWP2-3-4b2 TaxID=2804595 RepID=UPI003CEBEF5A
MAWTARAEHWRKPAIVAASLLLHAGVLAFLGLRTMGLESGMIPDRNPTIYVQLEPRPLLADETPRRPVTARQLEAPPLARALTTPVLRDEEDEDDRPAPPSPRLAAAAPGAPPAAAPGAWTVRPRTLGDRIGQGLRTSTVGCAAAAVLSPAERAICDERFGRRAAATAPIAGTGNPERDARFAREGAQRLAEYEALRRPLAGGIGIVGPQDGPGSNFGIGVAGAHLDQTLRPDSTQNIRTRRDGQRSSGTPLTPGGSFTRDPPRE